jgi:hypothetical protein
MVELIATILVVGLFLYYAWPWLWHIATTLATAFLVYYIVLPLEDVPLFVEHCEAAVAEVDVTRR